MQQALILAVQPQHCLNILTYVEELKRYLKILEMRKSYLKNFKGWCYIYETLGNKLKCEKCKHKEGIHAINSWVYCNLDDKTIRNINCICRNKMHEGSGKIIARFWYDCDKVERIKFETIEDYSGSMEDVCMYEEEYENICKNACLGYEEMYEYANGKDLYAWHIEQLEIFDEPMELSIFYKECEAVNNQDICLKTNCKYHSLERLRQGINPCIHLMYKPITRPPQSYFKAYIDL